MKRPPAIFGGVHGTPRRSAVRVVTIAALELCKVLLREGAVLLGDLRHVRPCVIHPGVIGRDTLREEDHVCLRAGRVGGERPIGEAQDRVKVAVLAEHLEDLPGLIRKEHIVRHDDRRTAAGLEDRLHMLNEIELLVARLDHKIFAVR